MTKYADLQQELLLMWSSRIKEIKGLTESGRAFPLTKPMFSVLYQSQKSYQAMLNDMKKQMRIMLRQMEGLQTEITGMLNMLEGHPESRTQKT